MLAASLVDWSLTQLKHSSLGGLIGTVLMGWSNCVSYVTGLAADSH